MRMRDRRRTGRASRRLTTVAGRERERALRNLHRIQGERRDHEQHRSSIGSANLDIRSRLINYELVPRLPVPVLASGS